jgi:hypothetical protein
MLRLIPVICLSNFGICFGHLLSSFGYLGRVSPRFSSLTCEDSGEIEQSGCELGLLGDTGGIHIPSVYVLVL